MALLLAIDIGTSSAKAVLFDPDAGKILAIAGEEYPLHQPTAERAEQNPADWWLSTLSVVGECLEKSGRRDIAAIGLTGQMHGTVLLDAKQNVLHPAIIWADSRSTASSQWMIDKLGADKYTSIAGTLPAVGFMGSTLVWLEQNQPDLMDRTRHVLLPKDYVRLKLTGEIATDISDASATGLFDITQRTWSKTILNAVLLRESILPTVLESTAIAGRLTPNAADALGLTAGIPVIAGCADQPAQAIASGLIAPGLASVTTGTGGQVCVPIKLEEGQPIPTDPRLHVFNHATRDMY
ncbi:MAG TPA: FGGY family carbohydrate kinase, partial [Phototrophicaceae bacterium]|nr:FGGY family carbohydrate kinase [Phototrophicaceae bacterium]